MEKIASYVTLGTVSAVLSVAAIIAGALGKSSLAVFFSDPSTAQGILTAIGSFLALVAGFSKGVAPVVVVAKETTTTTSVATSTPPAP